MKLTTDYKITIDSKKAEKDFNRIHMMLEDVNKSINILNEELAKLNNIEIRIDVVDKKKTSFLEILRQGLNVLGKLW